MINQDELIKGTLQFISAYKRLPYMSEDDIEVEKENDEGETEIKPYRSLKYINEYFGNHEKYSRHLLENNILAHDTISKHIDIPVNRLKELLKGDVEKVEIHERRMVDMFFNNDIYSHLGLMCNYCIDCTKKKSCSQNYWVQVINCPKHNKKKK